MVEFIKRPSTSRDRRRSAYKFIIQTDALIKGGESLKTTGIKVEWIFFCLLLLLIVVVVAAAVISY